jgi:hypothetical protein
MVKKIRKGELPMAKKTRKHVKLDHVTKESNGTFFAFSTKNNGRQAESAIYLKPDKPKRKAFEVTGLKPSTIRKLGL